MMIFPRKQTPPANFREGAVVQTLSLIVLIVGSTMIFLAAVLVLSGKHSTNSARLSVACHGTRMFMLG